MRDHLLRKWSFLAPSTSSVRQHRLLVCAVLIAATAVVAVAPRPAQAYGDDHYVWTYYIALQCGLTERQAYQVASGTFAVDWDPETAPLPGTVDSVRTYVGVAPDALRQIWRRFHAFTEESERLKGGEPAADAAKVRHMNRLRNAGVEDGNPGALFHYIQDFTPHFGWDDTRGHAVAGHLPDFLSADEGGAWEATLRTVTELEVFGEARKLPIQCDRNRLREVLPRMITANPFPVRMTGTMQDLQRNAEAAVLRGQGPLSSAYGQVLGVYILSGMGPLDLNISFSLEPLLQKALQAVRQAVREDKESGRLDVGVSGLPPDYGAMPDHWIQFDYDSWGRVGDPRYAVEEARFEVGDPTAQFRLLGEGPNASVEVKWQLPVSLGDLPTLGFLDYLPVELVSNHPLFSSPKLYLPEGGHSFTGQTVLPRSAVDGALEISFEVAAYSLGRHQRTLRLEADLPAPKPAQETTLFTDLLADLEASAAAASSSSQRARGHCESVAEIVEGLERQWEGLRSATARLPSSDILIQNSTSEDERRSQAALARAQTAADLIAQLRDEAARVATEACSGGVALTGVLGRSSQTQLGRLADAVDEIRGLATGGDETVSSLRKRAELEALLARSEIVADGARFAQSALNEADAELERLRSLDRRGDDVYAEFMAALEKAAREDPQADLTAYRDRAEGARLRIESAMVDAAGCSTDMRQTRLGPLQEGIRQIAELIREELARLAAKPPRETSSRAADDLRSAESLLSISEVFVESILNREQQARECTEPRPPESDTDGWGGGSFEPNTEAPTTGWEPGAMEQPCQTPAAQAQAVDAALARLRGALAQIDQYRALLDAVGALTAAAGHPAVCPAERAQVRDVLESISQAQQAQMDEAGAAMGSAVAQTNARRRRRDELWQNAARTLTEVLTVVERSRTDTGTTTTRGPRTGVSGGTPPTGGQGGPPAGEESAECRDLRERLMRSIEDWQRLFPQLSGGGADEQLCLQMVAANREITALISDGSRKGCVQLMEGTSQAQIDQLRITWDSVTCGDP